MTPRVTPEEADFLRSLPLPFTRWRKDPGFGSVKSMREQRMLARLQQARLVRVIVDEGGCTDTHVAFFVHRTELGELAAFPGRETQLAR